MYICGGIFHITHMPEVEIFQMSPHLSWGEIWNYSTCGENLDFYTSVMWRNLKLLHVWNSTHLPCIELWNFSTWQIFSPQIYRWDRWQISVMSSAILLYRSIMNNILIFVVLPHLSQISFDSVEWRAVIQNLVYIAHKGNLIWFEGNTQIYNIGVKIQNFIRYTQKVYFGWNIVANVCE